MPLNIYTIIVTWNGMKWIKKCLDSVRASSIKVNTIVIDNGSTDETVEFISQNYPEVILVKSDKNLGFGQANNEGMRIALAKGCDYVFLLNQDAYVFPDMFQELIRVSEKATNKQYAIISPLHINSDIRKLDYQFKSYIKNISLEIIQDDLLTSKKEIYEVESVPAAGWLLPRRTLEHIGGFDPIYFHYGEDTQYSQRVNYHGFKTGIVPSAKMIHDRENFGNEAMAKKDQVFRTLKAIYFLNINLSKSEIASKMSKVCLSFAYESVKNLCKGNFSIIYEYWKGVFRNVVKYSTYKKNRQINKTTGSKWLY